MFESEIPMIGSALLCASIVVIESIRQDNRGTEANQYENINQKETGKKTKMKTKKAHIMTVEEISAATTALDNQRGAMHFLLPVSPEVRSQTKRLGSKAVQVAEKRLKAAREHGELLPANFDSRGFEREVALAKALEQCRAAAARILNEVQDTLNQVGTEASRAGAEAYGYMRAAFATSPGLQRTDGDLSSRRTKASKDSAAATPAAPSSTQPAPAPTPTVPPATSGPEKKAA